MTAPAIQPGYPLHFPAYRARTEARDRKEAKLGTVVHPGRSSMAYAHVVLNGTDYAVNVHPYSCLIIT